MRLPASRPSGRFVSLVVAAALSACGGTPAIGRPASASAAPANGPAADYPVVVGDSYTAGGVSYTPEDKLNYDEVGYAAIDPPGGNAISGEHHTLPLPSYVEVTSLETGKTILLRLERRGPMDGTQLIGLSPGAAQQLGASAGTAVRVRRVNPPEQERALLRAGSQAPARIDTPMGLVNVLRRKLPGGEGPAAVATSTDLTAKPSPSAVPVPASAVNALPPVRMSPDGNAPASKLAPKPAPQLVAANSRPPPLPPIEPVGSAGNGSPAVTANIGKPGQQDFPWLTTPQKTPPTRAALPPVAKPSVPKAVAAAPGATPPPPAASKGFVVQAGAFSTRERAQGVAKAIGGSVGSAGKLYRVRTGPFTSHREAEASLAKVKAAGYSDARIYTSG